MKWLRRTFRRRRPSRVSKLERQLRLGLLQDAMGRAEQRQDDLRQVRNTNEPDTRSCPARVSATGWLGIAGG
jgi:hypothetical protein